MTERSGSAGPVGQAQAFSIDTRGRREMALFGGALMLGLVVMPLLIWIVGHRTLGPYTRGDDPHGMGPLALYGDYFAGLAHGWLGYWAVALGPAALLLLGRLWLAMLRRLPRD
ncbi:MAG: hypothetical protein WBV35_21515 [Steroidobacteraceae bacterium]